MERIVYQKTLDVHKNGVQFTLQGFETADNLARRIEISLMASGDAIDFPLEKIMAIMYVNVPGADGPSVIECEIKNNTVIYDVMPITAEGITEMQLKLIETGPDGAMAVLAAPKFAVEVTKSNADEEGAVQTSTFTALEDALAKAKAVYDSRFLSMELSSDCMFRVKYADGTVFESDMLREMFHKGETVLSQSYARGDTGVRKGEATDNSMYYSKVAKSASKDAEMSKEDAQEILDEVRLHGVYTAFTVNFDTGEVEYISPRYGFKINTETGDIDAEGQTFSFFDEVGELVNDWLIRRDIDVSKLLKISGEHSEDIAGLKKKTDEHSESLANVYTKEDILTQGTKELYGVDGHIVDPNRMFRIIHTELEKAKTYQEPWNVDENVGLINTVLGSFSGTSDTSTPIKAYSTNIVMINSGDVCLQFTIGNGNSGYAIISNVSVYHNESKIVSWDGEYPDNILDGKKLIGPLTVSKGDTLTIEMSIQQRSSNTITTYSISDIGILANIETPYKYNELFTSNVIPTDEIINTLLGVGE